MGESKKFCNFSSLFQKPAPCFPALTASHHKIS
nr:MAG TPA: hypothetical protein [Caudoviricetes sp.]